MKVIYALFLVSVKTETVTQFFEAGQLPGFASKTAELINDELLGLNAQDNVAMVLPTNVAWKGHEDLFEALKANKEQLKDVLLASCALVDSAKTFEEVKGFAKQNGGVVDTAYGTPISVQGDSLCLASFDNNGELQVSSKCTALNEGQEIPLDDGIVLFTDEIILPEQLMKV